MGVRQKLPPQICVLPDSVKVGPSPCDPVKCEKGSKENNNMQNSIPNIRAF